jgi:hypothetical protein
MNHALCEALVACPSEISRHRALSDSPAETGFLGRPGGLERPDAVWMHNMEAVDPNKPGCEPRLPWVPLGVASVAGFEWVMTLRLWENGAHNNHSRRGASLAATSNKSSLLRLPRTARHCNPCSDRNMSCGHQAGWVGMRCGPPNCAIQVRLMSRPCTRVPSCRATTSEWLPALPTCELLARAPVSLQSHPAHSCSGSAFSVVPAAYLWVGGSVKLTHYFARPPLPAHARDTRQALIHRSRYVRSSSSSPPSPWRVSALTLSESRCCLEQPWWLCAADCRW